MKHFPLIRVTDPASRGYVEVLATCIGIRGATEIDALLDLTCEIGSRATGMPAARLRALLAYELGDDVLAMPADPGALAEAVWGEVAEYLFPAQAAA